MKTEIERFYELVNSLGKISLTKATKEMNVNQDILEEWARALESKNLVKIHYPLNPLESPIISSVIGNNIPVKKVEKKKEKVKKEVKKKVHVKKKKEKKKTDTKLTTHIWR